MVMRKEKGDLALLGEIEKRLGSLPPVLLALAALAATDGPAVDGGEFTANDIGTLRQVVERIEQLSPEARALAEKRIEARQGLAVVTYPKASECALTTGDPPAVVVAASETPSPYPPSQET